MTDARFVKTYGIYQQRGKDMAALPSEVKKMLADVSGRLALAD